MVQCIMPIMFYTLMDAQYDKLAMVVSWIKLTTYATVGVPWQNFCVEIVIESKPAALVELWLTLNLLTGIWHFCDKLVMVIGRSK